MRLLYNSWFKLLIINMTSSRLVYLQSKLFIFGITKSKSLKNTFYWVLYILKAWEIISLQICFLYFIPFFLYCLTPYLLLLFLPSCSLAYIVIEWNWFLLKVFESVLLERKWFSLKGSVNSEAENSRRRPGHLSIFFSL